MSKRDADGDPRTARISGIEQVVAVVVVVDIHIVRLVPVVSPVLGIGIQEVEPIAAVLKARIAANEHERETVDPEPAIPAIVATKVTVRNSVAVLAALLPAALLGIPLVGTSLLPDVTLLILLFALLLLRALYLLDAVLSLFLLLLGTLLLSLVLWPLLLNALSLLLILLPLLLNCWLLGRI